MSSAPAIDADRYRAVMGRFVTGVTVVTTLDLAAPGPPRPFGTTVNSFTSVSLEPPLVLVTIGRERSILPILARTGRFTVNILAEGAQALSDCFAGGPGDVPRSAFCGAAWHPGPGGLPHLDGSLAWVDCDLERTLEAGDHTIHLGRVVGLAMGDSDDWPLLYFRRRYLRIERAEAADLRGKPDST